MTPFLTNDRGENKMREAETILEMKDITKSFNGISVLKGVNFELKKGEVHALMGGNGAGKSTLMKILTGVYEKDGGQIMIDGKEVSMKEPQDSLKNGVAMIFQEFSVIPTLTVAQNVYLNREQSKSGGFIDDKELNRKTAEILKELNVNISPKTLVGDLDTGYWQMTEIAKAISQNANILIMDEPSSALTKSETEILFDLIENLKSKGISIIYISHRMDEIYKVSDRITVLRDGKRAITSPCLELSMDELVENIVGKNMEGAFAWKERTLPENKQPVLEVKNLQSGHRVNGVSFNLYEGEILGIAGLMGSGRTEIVRTIFGIDPVEQGEIHINGKKQSIKSPEDAINAGMALVPEDRRLQGLILDHSVKENIILPILNKVSNGNFVQKEKANQISEELVKKLNIKTDSIFKTSRLLSGGNQQKIVLAKWLANNPTILMLDEPTAGVDIGAKTEIIDIIRELADNGKSVLVISSELPELLAVCDRILVLKDGSISKEMHRKEIHSEEVLEHAVQGI
jgi:ribose transport system ATP-binding protein